MEAELTNPI